MSCKWVDKSDYCITKLIRRCAHYGVFLFMVFYLLGSGAVAVAQGSLIENQGHFAPIGKHGWSLVPNSDEGIFGGDGYPNMVAHPEGSPRYSYAWSQLFWNDKLYVGTNRDMICFYGYNRDSYYSDAEICTIDDMTGIPVLDEGKRPGIWRYTPSSNDDRGDYGLSGTWELFFLSPQLKDETAYTKRTVLSALLPEAPREIGYRNMKACDCGSFGERLYIATLGVPGRILYTDGNAVYEASTLGLNYRIAEDMAGLIDLASLLSTGTTDGSTTEMLQMDLGYRAMACFKDRLWISPAGTFDDVDTADNHPVILANENPASAVSPWEEMLDVREGPLGKETNLGIFQFQPRGDDLYIGVINRDTDDDGGAEVWKGDASSGPDAMTWTKVVKAGAGVTENSIATMGLFTADDNRIYVGLGESGFEDRESAEMIRINTEDKYELLIGVPREGFMGDPAVNGYHEDTTSGRYDNMICHQDNYDDVNKICYPTSKRGPGFADPIVDPITTDLLYVENYWTHDDEDNPTKLNRRRPKRGTIVYLWRYQEYDDSLFVGTMEMGNPGRILKLDLADADTADTDFKVVVDDGFGNPNNSFRSFAVTPMGLSVGSANPQALSDKGGADVWIGTNAASSYPVVKITSPTAASSYGSTSSAVVVNTPTLAEANGNQLKGTVLDNDSDIGNVNVTWENKTTGVLGNAILANSTDPWTWSAAEVGLILGDNLIAVTATDNDGHSSVADPLTVAYVDNTCPTKTISSPTYRDPDATAEVYPAISSVVTQDIKKFLRYYYGSATVTVTNSCDPGAGVSGAKVTGHFTGRFSDDPMAEQTGVTDADGKVTFRTSGFARLPDYGFEVTSVSATGMVWDEEIVEVTP